MMLDEHDEDESRTEVARGPHKLSRSRKPSVFMAVSQTGLPGFSSQSFYRPSSIFSKFTFLPWHGLVAMEEPPA
jgi:hypothetical protein